MPDQTKISNQNLDSEQEQLPKKVLFFPITVKMLLAILLFAGIGTIIIGGGYIIREYYENATSWKTTEPVVRDKGIACNIDSDCYEYSPCGMGISCLNKMEYEMSIKRDISCPHVEIMPWQHYRYNKEKCTCSGGICIKVFSKERYCK